MRLEYLPPYSPDFDPIEEGFSSMKAWLRHNREYVEGELTGQADASPYTLLWRAVFESMTPEKIVGWYTHSGYM
jgi:transposase